MVYVLCLTMYVLALFRWLKLYWSGSRAVFPKEIILPYKISCQFTFRRLVSWGMFLNCLTVWNACLALDMVEWEGRVWSKLPVTTLSHPVSAVSGAQGDHCTVVALSSYARVTPCLFIRWYCPLLFYSPMESNGLLVKPPKYRRTQVFP